MSDRNGANELFNVIKTIVNNYLNNRKVTAVVIGEYKGGAVMVGDLPVPMSMVTGNMKTRQDPCERESEWLSSAIRQAYTPYPWKQRPAV